MSLLKRASPGFSVNIPCVDVNRPKVSTLRVTRWKNERTEYISDIVVRADGDLLFLLILQRLGHRFWPEVLKIDIRLTFSLP